jgi:hypothetical protein
MTMKKASAPGVGRRSFVTASRLLFSLFLSLALVPAFSQGSPGSLADLPARLDAMSANAWQTSLLTAFGTFTYAETGLPSPFSRYLEDELAVAISRSSRLKLFNRSVASAMDPAFRAIYGDFFKTNSVDALLSGRYYLEGRSVRARLELTGLSDGVLVGALDVAVPLSALPSGLSVDPSAVAASTASSLDKLAPDTPSSGFKVSVSTERGSGAVYREGESMVVLVTVNKSAWLKVYHIDASGVVRLIWPNAYTEGKRVDPGSVVAIPGSGDAFAFAMTPPFGSEFIKVVASTEPFSSSEVAAPGASSSGGAFAELGKDARRVITRGIRVSAAGKAEVAEAMASYVIVPANQK